MNNLKTLVLLRSPVAENGCYGEFYLDGEFVCYAIERAWKFNAPGISCIPDGQYLAEPYDSPTHGYSYIIHNEQIGVTKFEHPTMRWGILIHAANIPSQLSGCIAPVTGFQIMTIKGKTEFGGHSSNKAKEKLFALLNKEPVKLIIKPNDCEWNQ